MSFDRMNRFVDEHTVLMREFLRNISTLTDEEEQQLLTQSNNSSVLSSIHHQQQIWHGPNANKNAAQMMGMASSFVLTPQTPSSVPINNNNNNNSNGNNNNNNTTSNYHRSTTMDSIASPVQSHLIEYQFDLELIDLGKQLSILHCLLTSILTTLDEVINSSNSQFKSTMVWNN